MLKGFRDFILRGNVVELAVAVIIGAAFTAIVTSISEKIINPLIASVGTPDMGGLGFRIRPDVDATFLDFGAVITAVINFFIVAAIVYFIIVLPMNKLNELRTRGQVPEDVPPTSEELLTEIRDLLVAQQGGNANAVTNHPGFLEDRNAGFDPENPSSGTPPRH